MRIVSANEAIRALPDGSRVVLPHGSIEPSALYEALVSERGRFRDLRLYSGLQFGSYRYLDAGLGENFSYTTWQASGKLRPLFRDGRIDFLPMRFRELPRMVSPTGPLPPDVVFLQCTPPEKGMVNLGISASVYQDLARHAPLVIAELNENMPHTHGRSALPIDEIDLAVESSMPLGEYHTPRRTERDVTIADRVLEQIPRGATVQIGVGAIPDLVLERLSEVPETHLHSGMLTDGLIEFLEGSRHDPRVVTGEICGTPRLYDYVNGNTRVDFQTTDVSHGYTQLSQIPRFVSVNSAIEVDLQGHINGETVGGVQMSGAGGSLDFVEGAAASEGGLAILAMSSTTENGKFSKIVRSFGENTPTTIPRFCADVVVTEYGAAHLRGKTLRERSAALRTVAHPDFSGSLE